MGFALVVALGVYSFHKDFTLRRSKDAQDLAKAEFGYGNSISNEYFIVFGFCKGVMFTTVLTPQKKLRWSMLRINA